jgi:hypothetical protein
MSLTYYCIGMETTLFIFLLTVSIYLYVRGKVNWLPLLCTLTMLTRFEGAAIGLIIGWRLWQRRRLPTLASFVPAAILLIAYFVFNFYFYHAFLPHSATAKFGQGFSGYWGRWPIAFMRIPEEVFRPLGKSYVLGIGLIILAAFGIEDRRLSECNQIIIPFLLIMVSFYLLFNIPGYHWYYAPFLFILIIYSSSLIPETRIAQQAGLFFAICVVIGSGINLRKTAHDATAYVQMGNWINKNTPSNARIAAVETGTVGWFSDRYLIDMVGLTTPVNARYTAHRDFSSWFSEQPDFIIVHPRQAFPWENVALSSPEYELMPVHFDDVYLLRKKTSAK